MNYDVFGTWYDSVRRFPDQQHERLTNLLSDPNGNMNPFMRAVFQNNHQNIPAVSPAMAWQLAEASHMLGYILLNTESEIKPSWIQPAAGHAAPEPLDRWIGDDEASRTNETLLLNPIAFRLRIKVYMQSPIFIKGDRPLVASENPFCIDRLTGWPLLRPSNLKGQARHATWEAVPDEKIVNRLFGMANEEPGGTRGRVEFLPCYIKQAITRDVLTPHKEETRRVDHPVTLEVLDMRNDPFDLWLQYWPVDLMSPWLRGENITQILTEDWQALNSGIALWFDRRGIGAKTSSGFGKVDSERRQMRIYTAEDSPWRTICPIEIQHD